MEEEADWKIPVLTVICVMAIAYLSYHIGREIETVWKLAIFLALYSLWLLCFVLVGERIWGSGSP